MRVLFICSGNSKKFPISPIVKNQADSLIDQGIEIDFFPIKAKGIKGYLKHVKQLKRYLKANNTYDIIHAHYSFSAWVAVLAKTHLPIVVSLMGSDTYGFTDTQRANVFSNKLISLQARFLQLFCKHIIVKSENIYKYVWQKSKSSIIPNGINLDVFKPLDKETCRKELNLEKNKIITLFIGNPKDDRKNIKAAKTAIDIVNKDNKSVQLLAPFPVDNSRLPLYFNACDILVFPSKAEGSPNAVKEAMACNCPIVATNVGDIEWLFGSKPGHFLTSFDPQDVAEKITQALKFAESPKATSGRKRILALQLDSDSVAEKIIEVYQKILKNT